MRIPDYHSLMLPVLEIAARGDIPQRGMIATLVD
jgi:hypothetical protein